MRAWLAYRWVNLVYRLSPIRRRPWLSAAVGAPIVALIVLVAVGGGGAPSATLNHWQPIELVGVPGEAAGACAAALPPWWAQHDADRWIVCVEAAGEHRCYLQRLHALDFRAQPIRPSAFDADCSAALAVLRKADLLG